MIMKIPNKEQRFLSDYAKAMVAYCFRNTYLEDLHTGIFPSSKTGDYSDVKVVSPYGEIPWNELSRISDEEMKRLIKECVDKMFTTLVTEFMSPAEQECIRNRLVWNIAATQHWDEPKAVETDMKSKFID